MKPTDKIEQWIKNTKIKTNPEVSKAVLNDLLDRMDRAEDAQTNSRQPDKWRIIMKNSMFKLSAAAAVLIAVFIMIHSFVVVSPTFAEVIKPLFSANTITFDMIAGKEGQAPVIHDIVKGQFIRRTMSNMPNLTMIIDVEGKKMMNLDSQLKSAAYFDITGPLEEGTRSFLAFIRETLTRVQSSPDFGTTRLPQKELDGRMLIGFESSNSNEHIVVWADPKTCLPVRIEMKIGQQEMLIRNLEFDVPIDDSLVSMTLPAGYATKAAPMDLSNPTEEDFIEILRFWAKDMRDGQFPDTVCTQEFMNLINPLQEKLRQLNVSEEEGGRIGISYAKGMLFLQLYELHKKGPWHYAGKGVRFGDAGKAVFWYCPKDSATYRVIYGDLSVKDAAPENLPK